MSRVEEPPLGALDQHLVKCTLYGHVQSGRNSADRVVDDLSVLAAAEVVRARSCPSRTIASPSSRKPDPDSGGRLAEDAEHPDHRRRIDGPAIGLVVEGHVSARHRGAERPASVPDAPNDLGELPHDLASLLGAPEVEAVSDCRGPGPHGRDVASRLGDGEARSLVGVQHAVGGRGRPSRSRPPFRYLEDG